MVLLNKHDKVDYPPMHTAEHILNQTMVRLFGCPRSKNSHIERKKSKCDYLLDRAPGLPTVAAIEAKVNEEISKNQPVKEAFVLISEVPTSVDLSKLPDDVSETIRLVYVGDYDVCACIGKHVGNTSEIGVFSIISHDYEAGRWRVRWKVADK
jgi:misacylated tRNA(Ala) deacylase